MERKISIRFVLFFIAFISIFLFSYNQVYSQSPPPLHELRGLTDNDGTDHLFYRSFKRSGFGSSYRNDIYRYDTATGRSVIFLEDYFMDTETGDAASHRILDYDFFEGDKDKYIYLHQYGSGDCAFSIINSITRHDTTSGLYIAPIFDIRRLLITGDESSPVYAQVNDIIVRSPDGGITWFDPDLENVTEIPDSLILGFPLKSLSRYDKDLMFGFPLGRCGNEPIVPLLRSTDGGLTYEIIADTLLPDTFHYDSDETHIYFLYNGLYVSSARGAPGTWELRENIDGKAYLCVDRENSGSLFLSRENRIYYSADYGGSFDLLYTHHEPVTGIYKGNGDNPLYFITDQSLNMLTDRGAVRLLYIPVSVETDIALPVRYTLHRNYPNPFNQTTTISFSLPEAGPVTLTVYEITGRVTDRPLSGVFYQPGTHDIHWNAAPHSSGVYIYELNAGEEIQRRSMIYLK